LDFDEEAELGFDVALVVGEGVTVDDDWEVVDIERGNIWPSMVV
jgi:hypothetical protein